MGGGAWPFLVGGLICLVNSDNERDHNLLTSAADRYVWVKPFSLCRVATCGAAGRWILYRSADSLLRGTNSA
jgi:hypothetical protein